MKEIRCPKKSESVRLAAATRELRDRYLERIKSPAALADARARGRYHVVKQLENARTEVRQIAA